MGRVVVPSTSDRTAGARCRPWWRHARPEGTVRRVDEDRDALNEEVHAGWDAMAAYWDEQMAAGKTWQRNLIQPASSSTSSVPFEMETPRISSISARVVG